MRCKVISSLEKCFPDESLEQKQARQEDTMLKNEIYSFQICYDLETVINNCMIAHFHIDSPLAPFISVYQVKCIPSLLPVFREMKDEYYLRTTPGLYPDLLEPITEQTRLPVHNVLNALWIEVNPQGLAAAGSYVLNSVFTDVDGNVLAEASMNLEILDAELPKQDLIFTQWFYTDCLMQHYATKAFDENHWVIIENFMRNARKYGMNMILTPVLTPELDTYIGGERPTTQLVDIIFENGNYIFDFSRLGRWIDLCDKVGIEYLEINHFFSQWGATACPKVIAIVDGAEKKIFGWDTPSDGDAYIAFLQALIPQMLSYLKSKNGADKRCYFHLSDEPTDDDLEQYRKVSQIVLPLLEGYPVMDALSNYRFYEQGLVKNPIPKSDQIEPFLEHTVPNLWTYYCCGQAVEVSNRFFAMPSARNRIIGTQFYKYQIAGFLHWGYNFYNNQHSYAPVNPFLCSDGDSWVPSGDTYSVYPGPDGTPWPSLRQIVFNEALQDLRLLKLCESLYGREYTMELLEDGIAPITFKKYPRDDAFLHGLRRRLHEVVSQKSFAASME